MAPTSATTRLALTAALAFAWPAYAQDEPAAQEIVFTMDCSRVDDADCVSWSRRGDTYTFRGPRIETGDVLIEADEAVTTTSGQQFDGRWELGGSIRMTVGTARLTAVSAVFEFEDGELVGGELAGDPATFEEMQPEQSGPVRGEASRIVYEREAGTVQMQGNASFTIGPNSISGCDFLYELGSGNASSSNECDVPLSLIYRPDNDAEPDDASSDDAEPQDPASNDTPPVP